MNTTDESFKWQKWLFCTILAVALCILAFPRIRVDETDRKPELCVHIYSLSDEAFCLPYPVSGKRATFYIHDIYHWNVYLNGFLDIREYVGGPKLFACIYTFKGYLPRLDGSQSYVTFRPAYLFLLLEFIVFTLLICWIRGRVQSKPKNAMDEIG
jgi:hypothetical protein